MRVLGIETSCDETAASVIIDGKIYSNFIANQLVHEKYGGVVPELASRDHIRRLIPLLPQTLAATGRSLLDVDAIAYTQGPGLSGALLVG